MKTNRRTFIASSTASLALSGIGHAVSRPPRFHISVQQYSFNKQLRSGKLALMDFPATVVKGTGIKHLEYFNGHMMEKAGNTKWFKALKKRCDDLGVTNEFMLCKTQAFIDSPEADIRAKAVEELKPWMEAIKLLGGWGVRVDVKHPGDFEAQKKHAVNGLVTLSNVANTMGLDILVENHGGFSGNGLWVADVMERVALKNCGTLPDFQNFKNYDPYKGVTEMMPYAKAVCAKAKTFDKKGNETQIDYGRMMQIVIASKFSGCIGIEFAGRDLAPIEGILATKQLIQRYI